VRAFLILLAAARLLAAQEPAQERDLLPRIRAKMTDVLLRQPNYTCTETIERTSQTPGGRSILDDTLRLEVALVEGKEMFAWPGSKEFEDHRLRELVPTGMFGNGNFAIYARILFLSDAATVEDRGETQWNGHPARRYDFRVSQSTGGHRLRVNNREAVVGFHGSFYADPVTLEVLRVEVVAEDIPADLGVTASETSVDYSRLRISDEEFLLPVESTVMMALPDEVSRNSIRFADCRRFTGESTLSFNDPVLTEAPAPAEHVVDVTIPAGLTLQLQMPDLDLMHAAVGDPIRATLRSDLKNRGKLLAPKGSVASGRIVLLDRSPGFFALRIDFQDLDWPGGHAGLKLLFAQQAFASRLIGRRVDGTIEISREAGPHLSGILMFWRSE
jgi:hypothetical protein